MNKKIVMPLLCALMLVLTMTFFYSSKASADNSDAYGVLEIPEIPIGLGTYGSKDSPALSYIRLLFFNDSEQAVNVTMTSDDPDIMKPDKYPTKLPADTFDMYDVTFKAFKPGITTLNINVGKATFKTHVYVYKKTPSIKSVTQPNYNTIKITWNKGVGFTGYSIERAVSGTDDFKQFKFIDNASTGSYTFESNEWGKAYDYRVRGYFSPNLNILYDITNITYTLKKQSSEITNIANASNSSAEITWGKVSGAIGYKLYRSTSESGNYTCVYETDNPDVTSCTNKISPNYTYYYRLKTVYPEFLSDYSVSYSKRLPSNAKTQKRKFSSDGYPYINTQYSVYWASTDPANLYTLSNKLYTIVPGKNCIRIYPINSSLKRGKAKTIKLKYNNWGGFYNGTDGYFYVVVGYANSKESSKKIVIKIIKYTHKWQKVKTANISGGVTNVFKGIYFPFADGNCSMDMKGNTLYIHKCRLMFVNKSDGLRHQSNISFAVNTKTMKAVTTQDSYVSHSFNQYVKYNNDNLYLLDHGDGWPRSINLDIFTDYGKHGSTSNSVTLFKIKGKMGDNFTGCTVGGMEIGRKNVMVCGTAQPHFYKIKGVTGFKSSYAYNVYLIVADKKTGKHTLKWITNYNPKTTKVSISDTRMVKLDDNRFGILYSTDNGKTSIVHYVVVDNSGKKLYSKQFSNISFSGGMQPIVYKNRVIWLDSPVDWSVFKQTTYILGIPALQK